MKKLTIGAKYARVTRTRQADNTVSHFNGKNQYNLRVELDSGITLDICGTPEEFKAGNIVLLSDNADSYFIKVFTEEEFNKKIEEGLIRSNDFTGDRRLGFCEVYGDTLTESFVNPIGYLGHSIRLYNYSPVTQQAEDLMINVSYATIKEMEFFIAPASFINHTNLSHLHIKLNDGRILNVHSNFERFLVGKVVLFLDHYIPQIIEVLTKEDFDKEVREGTILLDRLGDEEVYGVCRVHIGKLKKLQYGSPIKHTGTNPPLSGPEIDPKDLESKTFKVTSINPPPLHTSDEKSDKSKELEGLTWTKEFVIKANKKEDEISLYLHRDISATLKEVALKLPSEDRSKVRPSLDEAGIEDKVMGGMATVSALRMLAKDYSTQANYLLWALHLDGLEKPEKFKAILNTLGLFNSQKVVDNHELLPKAKREIFIIGGQRLRYYFTEEQSKEPYGVFLRLMDIPNLSIITNNKIEYNNARLLLEHSLRKYIINCITSLKPIPLPNCVASLKTFPLPDDKFEASYAFDDRFIELDEELTKIVLAFNKKLGEIE